MGSFKSEQEKEYFEKALKEKETKINELERDLDNEKTYNEHAATTYHVRTIQHVHKEAYHTEEEKQPESSSNNSILHDPEYIAQKNRWNQMEQEADELKTHIKNVFVPTPGVAFKTLPDRVFGSPFLPNKLRDEMIYSPEIYKKVSEKAEENLQNQPESQIENFTKPEGNVEIQKTEEEEVREKSEVIEEVSVPKNENVKSQESVVSSHEKTSARKIHEEPIKQPEKKEDEMEITKKEEPVATEVEIVEEIVPKESAKVSPRGQKENVVDVYF